MSTDVALGIRLSDTRENKNYSTLEIARRIGVTEKTIKNWESGKSKPRANKLQMLSGVLGVPLLWLINGEEQFEQYIESPSQLEALSKKVERLSELQQEMNELTEEVVNEVEELHKIEEDLELLKA